MSLSPAKPNHRRHSLAVAVLGLASLTFSGGRAVDAGDKPGAAPAKKLSQEEEALALKVNAAIDSGKKWLIDNQTSDGTWTKDLNGHKVGVHYGEQSLVLFALVKSGLTAKDECIKKGLKALDRMLKEVSGKSLASTGKIYEVSCAVLLYAALFDQRKTMPGGAAVESRMKELVGFLQNNQRDGGWRYPMVKDGDPTDLSNTQFSLYALHMAATCGIPVKPEVFRKAFAYLLDQQKKTGKEVDFFSENPTGRPEDGYDQWKKGRVVARGWGYVPKDDATGSMTTAGLSALAIVRENLDRLKLLTEADRKAIDASMLGGIAWLADKFIVEKNPGGDLWGYFYLYGIERTGSFLNLRYIGKNDWYPEGAEFLVRQQQKDGTWPAGESAILEPALLQTILAMLFLERKSPQTSYTPSTVTEPAESAPAPDPRDAKPEDPENSK